MQSKSKSRAAEGGKVNLRPMIGNLRHAARNNDPADIGGGLFMPAECAAAADALESAPALAEEVGRLRGLLKECTTAIGRPVTGGDLLDRVNAALAPRAGGAK